MAPGRSDERSGGGLDPEGADHLVTGPSIEKSTRRLRRFASPNRCVRRISCGRPAQYRAATGAKGLNPPHDAQLSGIGRSREYYDEKSSAPGSCLFRPKRCVG